MVQPFAFRMSGPAGRTLVGVRARHDPASQQAVWDCDRGSSLTTVCTMSQWGAMDTCMAGGGTCWETGGSDHDRYDCDFIW